MRKADNVELVREYGLAYILLRGEVLVYIPTVRAQGYWLAYENWFAQRERLRREFARESDHKDEKFAEACKTLALALLNMVGA